MAEIFDLFCFEHCESMLDILTDPIISVIEGGGQVPLNYPDPAPPPETTCDLGVLSGELGNGAFPTDTVFIQAEPLGGVGSQWTVEWSVTFESLPPDFSDLINQHVFLGASDAVGPIAGIFISAIGISYTGSIHISGGDIVLDTPVTAIPNTSQYIELGVQTRIRLVADAPGGVVYLYVTPEADVVDTGHRLIGLLNVIDASEASTPPIDESLISVRGTTAEPSRVAFDKWCAASSALIPNIPPIANAGSDQAVRFCAVVQLDGSASTDPDSTGDLTYNWRLIGAPENSAFTISGNDGRTYPLISPTGFTDRFHSASLGTAHALDNLDSGDVLSLDTEVYNIVSTGTDVNGFYALIDEESIPDSLTPRPYRVYRQRGISGPTTVSPTFLGDVTGFYRFDLIVNDGDLNSQPSIVVVNVVDSPLPRGLVPDTEFIFDYLSDYWSLLEDRESIVTFWSGLAQVAASELYTLWQHDYSKSLRDIQRTFIRRWLHYDLLLAEPVPELSTFRVLYGGVSTSDMDAGGESGISGTGFLIGSPVHAARTITVVSANPVTAPQLAAELLNRLLEVDSRYTTQVITRLSGDQFVRINAPFPFTIVSSTLPFLSTGVSTLPSGTGGSTISTRTYKVDVSLDGLGVQENDLLVLGDQAFQIAQVTSNSADDLPFSRVTLKSDIPQEVITDWTISGYARSEMLDFYNGLVSAGDNVFFAIIPVSGDGESILSATTVVGVSSEDGSNLAFLPTDEIGYALATPELVTVQIAKVVRRTYIPIDTSIVDIPTLVELLELKDDEATLRRNLDFFIEEYRGQHCVRFVSGQFSGDDVWEAGTPPDRLWAEYTYLDNNETIQANFGILADVSIDQIEALPGDVDYLSAIRGIWYAYLNGPTLFNLRVGAQILLGLPFAEEAGTIEEIRTDFSPSQGRILIRDSDRTEIVRSYTFPRSLDLEVNPATGAEYAAGDSVSQFAPLVKGVEVIDYVKDPDWFVGLLNQGIFAEVEKFWRFLVRVDSAAFGLESLSFVRDFILKIKPTPTYPVFLVSQQLDQNTDISVTDQLEATVTVRLLDNVCADLAPFSTSFDDPRPSTGGFWNQFDTDSNDATPPPTFPTPDAVEWAFDRYVLCPEDLLQAHICEVYPAPAPAGDSANLDDTKDLINDATFKEAGPFTIANGATGEDITADVGDTVPLDGTIERVRVLIAGGPGVDPAGYEVVVAVNGVDTITESFTSAAIYTLVAFAESEPVVATDVITARIRHAGGSPRSPDWDSVRIDVSINLGDFDAVDVLPIGNYCVERDPLI